MEVHVLHLSVLAGWTAVLVLHVIFDLSSAARTFCTAHGRWWAVAMPMPSRIWASLKTAMAFADVDVVDERALFRETVAKRIDIRRNQLMRWLLPRVNGFAMVLVAYLAFNTFQEVDRWFTPAQDTITVTISLVLIIWQRFPQITDATGSLFFSSVVMILFVGLIVFDGPTHPAIFAIQSAAVFGARFLFCVASMRRRLTIACSTLTFAANTFVLLNLPKVDACVIVSSRHNIVFELLYACLLIFCSEAVRGWVVCHVCDEIEIAETKSGSSAAVALLNTVCDASAQLDEHLVISENAPRLGAMLLHSSSRSLKGVPFPNLLSSQSDRETFANRTRARADVQQQENELADLFHVHIRDNTNNDVEVEVYLVSFAGYCDQAKFLVGIREQAADVVVQQAHVPVRVSFDASTFKVVRRSSSFDLRGPNGSCEVGGCLRKWCVPCVVTDTFFEDLQMAVGAVGCSRKPVSFTSSVVLQDLVKPGTEYVSGHRFLATCSVRVSLENVKLEHVREGVGGDLAADNESGATSRSHDATTHASDRRGSGLFAGAVGRSDGVANEANDDVAASNDLDAGRASTLSRTIVTMQLDTIKRERGCRGRKMSKPELRAEGSSFSPRCSAISERMNPTIDSSNQPRSEITILDHRGVSL